ncbi:hypothetical protein [Salmonella enterica]
MFDGQGLTLFVRTNGKKIWRFRSPGACAGAYLTGEVAPADATN